MEIVNVIEFMDGVVHQVLSQVTNSDDDSRAQDRYIELAKKNGYKGTNKELVGMGFYQQGSYIISLIKSTIL